MTQDRQKFINIKYFVCVMATSIDSIQRELIDIKKDVEFIKNVLSEDFELSDYAKKGLKEARETPESEYVDLE